MAVPLSTVPAASWWSIAYLVIIGSISFIAYIYMLQKLPPEINSIYAYVNPIVAVLLVPLFFGETLTVAIGIGGLMSGLYMVNHSIKKNKRILAGNKV
jgi:drug/metabolite transporter (DMT)-like permease